MNLSTFDLNLFVVLQAVLAEGSATRAAARLHVTQSAVSNALARLRALLGDPLVLRTRRGLIPTPRALALQPQLEAALATLEAVTRESPRFDARTTTREWAMSFAELYGPILLPALVARLRVEAPNASLRVVTLEHMAATDALATGEIDLYVGIPGKHSPAWRDEPLFADDMVGIMRKDHAAARRRMTLATFLRLPHVQGRVMPNRGREVDDALARRGLARRVVLTVPHYGAICAVVAASDCLAVVSGKLARYYAARFPLRVFTLPLTLPKLMVSMHWHMRADRDPAVLALRGFVREILR